MKDLNELFIKAKAHKTFNTEEEIDEVINCILQNDNTICLDWDKGAGEDWIRFYRQQSGVICMLHKRIGIAFVRTKELNEKIQDELSKLYLVNVDSYNLEEWCIDTELLENATPEVTWHASPNAVDVENISLNDLYYATV